MHAHFYAQKTSFSTRNSARPVPQPARHVHFPGFSHRHRTTSRLRSMRRLPISLALPSRSISTNAHSTHCDTGAVLQADSKYVNEIRRSSTSVKHFGFTASTKRLRSISSLLLEQPNNGSTLDPVTVSIMAKSRSAVDLWREGAGRKAVGEGATSFGADGVSL